MNAHEKLFFENLAENEFDFFKKKYRFWRFLGFKEKNCFWVADFISGKKKKIFVSKSFKASIFIVGFELVGGFMQD